VLTRSVLSAFTRKVNISLERTPDAQRPPIRKRITILASRFGTNMDTVCTRIKRLERLTFKFNSTQPREVAWAIKSVTTDKVRSAAIGGSVFAIPGGGAGGGAVLPGQGGPGGNAGGGSTWCPGWWAE
jgi:hypothetical protein